MRRVIPEMQDQEGEDRVERKSYLGGGGGSVPKREVG